MSGLQSDTRVHGSAMKTVRCAIPARHCILQRSRKSEKCCYVTVSITVAVIPKDRTRPAELVFCRTLVQISVQDLAFTLSSMSLGNVTEECLEMDQWQSYPPQFIFHILFHTENWIYRIYTQDENDFSHKFYVVWLLLNKWKMLYYICYEAFSFRDKRQLQMAQSVNNQTMDVLLLHVK